MKRICYINSYACMGGAEMSLKTLICGFKARGYEVSVILGEKGPMWDWLVENNIKTQIIHQPSLQEGMAKYIFPFYILKYMFQLAWFLKKNKIDIIHTNTFRSRIYTALIKFLFKGKMIAHVRDIEYSRYNEFLLASYDKTIVISKAVKECILQKIDNQKKYEKKIELIPNGVNYVEVKNCIRKGSLRIGMFARYDEWKCHHIFVEAINIVMQDIRYNDIEFYIYGEAIRESEKKYKEKIKSLIDSLGLNNNISLMGFHHNPIEEMSKMDLIVCPSDNEPFGRVIIEAMSAKTIVIASSNGGVMDILADKFSDLLFEPRSGKALADKIIFFIENKELIENKYTEKLFQEYMDKYSESALLNKVEPLY